VIKAMAFPSKVNTAAIRKIYSQLLWHFEQVYYHRAEGQPLRETLEQAAAAAAAAERAKAAADSPLPGGGGAASGGAGASPARGSRPARARKGPGLAALLAADADYYSEDGGVPGVGGYYTYSDGGCDDGYIGQQTYDYGRHGGGGGGGYAAAQDTAAAAAAAAAADEDEDDEEEQAEEEEAGAADGRHGTPPPAAADNGDAPAADTAPAANGVSAAAPGAPAAGAAAAGAAAAGAAAVVGGDAVKAEPAAPAAAAAAPPPPPKPRPQQQQHQQQRITPSAISITPSAISAPARAPEMVAFHRQGRHRRDLTGAEFKGRVEARFDCGYFVSVVVGGMQFAGVLYCPAGTGTAALPPPASQQPQQQPLQQQQQAAPRARPPPSSAQGGGGGGGRPPPPPQQQQQVSGAAAAAAAAGGGPPGVKREASAAAADPDFSATPAFDGKPAGPKRRRTDPNKPKQAKVGPLAGAHAVSCWQLSRAALHCKQGAACGGGAEAALSKLCCGHRHAAHQTH
jgi:hypothetical protein